MNYKRWLLAWCLAPAGAGIVMGAWLAIAAIAGGRVRPTPMLVGALAIAYIVGLVLFPAWWLFEREGWRGWRYYVPAAAFTGFWTSYLGMGGLNASWQTHVICVLSGAASALIFSIVLAPSHRSHVELVTRTSAPSRLDPRRGSRDLD